MNRTLVINLENSTETAPDVLEELKAQGAEIHDLQDFLAEINGGDTAELAHQMFKYLEDSRIVPGISPHVDGWTFQQVREFHRLAHTNFDWVGAEVEQAVGRDPTQKQWQGILNNYPSLRAEPAQQSQ